MGTKRISCEMQARAKENLTYIITLPLVVIPRSSTGHSYTHMKLQPMSVCFIASCSSWDLMLLYIVCVLQMGLGGWGGEEHMADERGRLQLPSKAQLLWHLWALCPVCVSRSKSSPQLQ